MSKSNPYYDEEGTGEGDDTPLLDELEVSTSNTKTSQPPEVHKETITPQTVVEPTPVVPVTQPAPIAVPMPAPKIIPVPVMEAVTRNPSRPVPLQDIKEELKQEEKEVYIPVAVVPQGFREVVEFTPARQRAERTKFNFVPEPLGLEDNVDRVAVSEETVEAEKSKTLFKVKKINPYAGGRWKILAIRYTVWGVLALIALGGVRTIFFPSKANIPALAQTIGAQLNINGFPIQSGQDLARSFTREYLTINPKTADQRPNSLAHFLPNGKTQSSWTSSFSGATQESVISGPILVEAPNLVDKTHAIFTFSAEVKSGSLDPQWVYLAVTVFSDPNGLVTISGPPAFVNNPGVPSDGGAYPFIRSDSASASLSADLPGFFKSWATSDTTGLALYTQSNATKTVTDGLNGSVSFIGISNLNVAAVDLKNPTSAYGQRYAEVYVTWQSNGNTWVQGYRLTVLQTLDGKWYIQDIFGGGFGATP